MLQGKILQQRIYYPERILFGIEEFLRQAKSKGVHDHYTNLTGNVKGTFL